MADNIVKIKFEGNSDTLTKAITKLDTATKNLLKTQAKIQDFNKKSKNSTSALKEANRKLFLEIKSKGLKSIKDLNISTKTLTNAYNGNKFAIRKVREELKKLNNTTSKTNKGVTDLTTGNRILGGTFAVLRSKALLAGFAIATVVRPIMNLINISGRLESVSMAFTTLSGGTDQSSIALEKLKTATDGTMSSFNLFTQANNAMILGVTTNSDEMAEMFDIAQRLGRALGRDTKSSVESLITGIGRQSRLMLDNIGIIVDSEKAYKKYAESIGTTSDKLTDSQKKQAFFNETMESAREKVSSLGSETLTSQDRFALLGAELEETGASIGVTLTPAVIALSEALRSGAVLARGFFDTINNAFGLVEEPAEEIPLKDQISFLTAELNSLVEGGLADADSLVSLFGTTMGALPIEDTTFNITELGFQMGKSAEEVREMQSQLKFLKPELAGNFRPNIETPSAEVDFLPDDLFE